MNARLKLNLDRLTGTFDIDPSSSRIYSRDAAIDLIVHGFDEGEVTPVDEGGATPPGKPVVQFVNSAGRVVAQAMLAQPIGDGAGGAGADGKYDLIATLSTNTVEMRREFFGAGPQAVREFTVRILDTETANPIACGPFPVFNFPGVCGDAPTELPSASEILAELRQMIEEHAGRTDNPHAVTAALLSALTQADGDARYALKASVTTLSGQATQAVQQSAAAVAAMRQHADRSDNPHGVTAAQVGLGNVDNTADADKPVSTRQQAAIAAAKEQVANLVQSEARRAIDREQELQNKIDEEGSRAASAETDLGRAIRTEKERAQGAEAALGSTKQDKLSSQQLAAVNSGIDADKVAKIAQNESAISAEVSRATTEEARLQALINAIKTFDAVVADSLPNPSEQYSKKLYLIPSANPETRNVKDEFICVKVDNVWGWEQVGSTDITIEFDNEPTEGSQKAARSGGIWSWVKSLLPSWLTSDYAEPATVASVAAKRDKVDLAVYSVTRTENTDWTWTSENKELEAALNEASVKPIYDSENHFWVITGTTHWDEFYYNSPGVYDVDALSVRLAFITIPGYVDYYATATRPRYMDESIGTEKPNQQLAAVATDDEAKPANGSLMKYDAANDRFVKAVEGTDYLKTHQDISGKLDKSGGQMTGTLSGGAGFGWIMNRQGESLDDTLGTFPTYIDLDTKADRATTLSGYGITDGATKTELVAAVSTNNPAFVSAVQNTPAPEPGQGEDPPWGTWGTVGAAIAGLVAGLKWLKDKVFDSAGNIQDQFATDLLGKQVAISAMKYGLASTSTTVKAADRTVTKVTLGTTAVTVTFPDADENGKTRDFLLRIDAASIATGGSLTITKPTGATIYGDAFPSPEATKQYLVAITETAANEFYVRTIEITIQTEA